MRKPIKIEDFLREKGPIESLENARLIHSHVAHFNDDITEYVTDINCAVLRDNKFDDWINLKQSIDNIDGYLVGEWEMNCPSGLKLGNIIDRMPFGIIDKTITGFGATTLELTTQIRSSIVVVPTKALAYNKHIATNKIYPGLTLYVGSKYGDITSDININDINLYLQQRKDNIRKFITVADSLPKLIKTLESLNEDVFKRYFLMIDEIDTLQMDSSYRPRLECVTDYYFKFDFMNRAMVSATIIPFSNKDLEKEGKITFREKEPQKRSIRLLTTNYVDDAAKSVITPLLTNTDNKILVAYNSLDGIFNIIKLLGLGKLDYGILCSNMSIKKVREFNEEALNAIDVKGFLLKKITFITCAFFAGIDIMDSCHLISISSSNQPFTYLSLEKFTQIAGRCRNGNLSETIIHDFNIRQADHQFVNEHEYSSSLLQRAEIYSKFLNTISEMVKKEPNLYPMNDFINSYMDFIAQGKSSMTDYPLRIIRKHSLTGKFIPSYFNIDALIDRWKIIHNLYSSELSLYNALISHGHNVELLPPLFLNNAQHNKEEIKKIKEQEKERLIRNFEKLKNELLAWKDNGCNKYALDEIRRETPKKLQNNVISPFEQLYLYIPPAELLKHLESCFDNDRKLRNFINSAIFYSLPNEHPFKSSLLLAFSVDCKSGEGNKKYPKEDRYEILKKVYISVLKMPLSYSEEFFSDFLSSFFTWKRNKNGYRVSELNPKKIPPLIKHMPINQEIHNLFRFPK